MWLLSSALIWVIRVFICSTRACFCSGVMAAMASLLGMVSLPASAFAAADTIHSISVMAKRQMVFFMGKFLLYLAPETQCIPLRKNYILIKNAASNTCTG